MTLRRSIGISRNFAKLLIFLIPAGCRETVHRKARPDESSIWSAFVQLTHKVIHKKGGYFQNPCGISHLRRIRTGSSSFSR